MLQTRGSNHFFRNSVKIYPFLICPIPDLNLNDNSIQNKGAQIISQRWLKHLKGLSLTSNPISELGVQSLAENLPESLQRLDLASLLALDVSTLVHHLPKSLRELDLSGNQISDTEMSILVPHLPANLAELNLDGSTFGIKGAWELAQGIPPKLTALSLNGVPIQSQGFEVIAKRLPETLTELKLSDLTLEASAVQALVAILESKLFQVSGETPSGLQLLYFPSVGLTYEKGKGMNWIRLLPKGLDTLDVSGNELGEIGLKQLEDELKKSGNPFDLYK